MKIDAKDMPQMQANQVCILESLNSIFSRHEVRLGQDNVASHVGVESCLLASGT